MIENLYLIPNFFLFSLLMNFKINFANNNFNAKNPNKKKFQKLLFSTKLEKS